MSSRRFFYLFIFALIGLIVYRAYAVGEFKLWGAVAGSRALASSPYVKPSAQFMAGMGGGGGMGAPVAQPLNIAAAIQAENSKDTSLMQKDPLTGKLVNALPDHKYAGELGELPLPSGAELETALSKLFNLENDVALAWAKDLKGAHEKGNRESLAKFKKDYPAGPFESESISPRLVKAYNNVSDFLWHPVESTVKSVFDFGSQQAK